MKPACIVMAATAMIATHVSAAAASDADMDGGLALRVMSFNIRYGLANDGDNAWEHRKDIAVRMIAEADPDIIGLQECLDFQAEYVVAHLPQYRWFGIGREADGSGEHMAVLYRASRLTPLRTGNFWLSEQPDEPGSRSWDTACTRMVTWAAFRHPETDARFLYYNTHFDHVSEEARVASARLLAERAKADANAATPVIITGDFNAPAGKSAPWETLADSGLQDAWLIAETRQGSMVTYTGFKPPRAEGDSRIDWILLSPGIAVSRCEAVEYNEDGRYPSDHLPVFADIRLPKAAEQR